jgi:hypothetical protein
MHIMEPARALRPSTLMSVAPPLLFGPACEAKTSVLGFFLSAPSSTAEAPPKLRKLGPAPDSAVVVRLGATASRP